MNDSPENQMSRRHALRWVIAASATVSQLRGIDLAFAQDSKLSKPYGTDPLLNRSYKPGDFWPLTLDAGQRRTVAALADLILPADEKSPAASNVGVTDFIDEWISAPYPEQQRDRVVVLEGLQWLDVESKKRFQKEFTMLTHEQQSRIGDDICYAPKAAVEFKSAASFFSVFRSLTLGGFYTSKEGMKDIGYIGNAPQTSWPGPPTAVLKQLGLAG
jgi:hypothetical protein